MVVLKMIDWARPSFKKENFIFHFIYTKQGIKYILLTAVLSVTVNIQ